MNNRSLIRVGVIIMMVLGLIFFIRFVIGGNEDEWICTKGGWVKHGNPNAPAPSTECIK